MGRSRLVCVFTGFPKVQSIRLRRLFQPPVPDSVDFGIPVDQGAGWLVVARAG